MKSSHGETVLKQAYTPEFFEDRQPGSRRSADRVVPMIVELIRPRSVVDIGCGVGTWLAAFSGHGVADIADRS